MVDQLINGLYQSLWGNTVADYCWSVGVLLLGFAVKRPLSILLCRLIFRLVRRESEEVSSAEFLRLLCPPIELLITLLIFFVASESLSIPTDWGWAPVEKFGARMLIFKVYLTAVIAAFTWLGVRFIKFMGLVFKQKTFRPNSKFDEQLVLFFRDVVILLFVITMIFVGLSRVFLVDVLTLLTSLGIGGLAIALAARETLENLFASFALTLDRPFTVGDAINLGGVEGTVQVLGFRSTRLRTFDGSLITVPNRLLTSQSLENLSRRRLRRAKYVIRLALDTPAEKLKAVVEALQQYIDSHPETRQEPGVIRFDTFGESSLDILVVFYVETALAFEFNRVKEEVNLKIVEIVDSTGVRFAFPDRELYIRKESPKSPLA